MVWGDTVHQKDCTQEKGGALTLKFCPLATPPRLYLLGISRPPQTMPLPWYQLLKRMSWWETCYLQIITRVLEMSSGTQPPLHTSRLAALPPPLPAFLAPCLGSCHWKPLLAASSLHCARSFQELHCHPKTCRWRAHVAILAFFRMVPETLCFFRLLLAPCASGRQRRSPQGCGSQLEIAYVVLGLTEYGGFKDNCSQCRYAVLPGSTYWVWTRC